MEVFIMQLSGPLTNSGTELRKRAKVDRIDVGLRYVDFTEFKFFYQAHLNGVQVGDSNNVILISGGRKSINRELSSHPLQLIPALGQSLAMRIIVQNTEIHQRTPPVTLAAAAPEMAIRQAHGKGGSISSRMAYAGKVFVGIHETAQRIVKKFAFLQIYSGPLQLGDYAVHHGHNPVNTLALVNQLRGIAGWRAD